MSVSRFSFFFFFSSRRRHTRSKRDWSSDVCSSDLAGRSVRRVRRVPPPCGVHPPDPANGSPGATGLVSACFGSRSEERRVGKECRCRGGPEQEKKKK